jgi:hypothetical protein
MKIENAKQNIKTQRGQWGAWLLSGLLLTSTLALFPAPAQAATTPHVASVMHRGPRPDRERVWGHGGPVLKGFWVTGILDAVEEQTVTITLPDRNNARGMMRNISVQVELAVDDSSILLDNDLNPLAMTTLQAGDQVVIVPRLVWGNLTVRLLYVGTPEELTESTYMGHLLAEDTDTLTLENQRDGEFTVVVDEETIWYDDGQMERPAELPEDTALRVLGIQEENEAGEEVIRAILITPGLRGF